MPILEEEDLAAFRDDPCASSWYGFIVRRGLLVRASEVHRPVWDMDPFPGVTALALADAERARDVALEREVD
jgi:hypothetical protein